MIFATGPIPKDAQGHPLEWRFHRLDALGEGGDGPFLFQGTDVPTVDPSNSLEPPLPGAERIRFERAVLACWDPETLSPEASETWVSLGINLSREGYVTGITLLAHHDDSDDVVREAFELAQMAVMHCLTEAYVLPQEMYGQWQQMRVDFDPIPLIEP